MPLRSLFAVLLVITLSMLIPLAATAAGPVHIWSKQYGGTNDQLVRCMTLDAAGNIIIAGDFRGTIDFGGGPLTTDPTNNNIFVAKLDPTGGHIWSKRFGDAGYQAPAGVAVSSSGNILLVGNFGGTLDFGGGPLTAPVYPGAPDAFVAELDASGAHLWSAKFGDAVGSDGGISAAFDTGGNLLVAGFTSAGSIDLGGGPLNTTYYDGWLVKFSPAGTHLWSRRIGDVSTDPADGEFQFITTIATDSSDDVLITGVYLGTVDFGNGAVTASRQDMFLTRYDAGGTYVRNQTFASSSPFGIVNANSMAIDGSDNVAVGGVYLGSVDFGGGPLLSPGDAPFLVSFDSAGNHRWSHGFPAHDQAQGISVATNSDGEVSFVGDFADSLNLGGDWLDTNGTSSQPTPFVAKYDANGVHMWSKGFNPFSPGGVTAVEATGDVYASGYFSGSINFGGSTFTSQGSDTYLVRYGDGTLLPVLVTRFDATPGNAGITLRWELWSDEAIERFTVFRSEGTSAPTAIAEISDVRARSFVDRSVEPGRSYRYELAVHTKDGDVFRSPPARATSANPGLALGENRPNPFNPQTTIPYQLPGTAKMHHVELRVVDATGQVVRTLVNEDQPAGSHTVDWNGRDDSGNPVASGMYFSVLKTGKERLSRKMVVLK